MDLVKIGKFLQELRKEKGMTQEQLAEQLGVSQRTVSRWETGSNMPDLDILIELSDFYEADLREILRGERKKERMDQELKETVLQVADYSKEEKTRIRRRMRRIILILVLLALTLGVLWALDHRRNHSPAPEEKFIFNDDMTGEFHGVLETEDYYKKEKCVCLVTLRFTWEKHADGSYSFVDFQSVHLEKYEGWKVVGDAEIVSDITYRNDRKEADVLVKYQASTGPSCEDEFYLGVISLDVAAQKQIKTWP